MFLYLQMVNSLRSESNGLKNDWNGMKTWLKLQSSVIIWRAFLSVIFYPTIIQKMTDSLEPLLTAYNLKIYNWGFSGLAGFGACGVLYQLTGLFSSLRGREPANFIPPITENESDTGAQENTVNNSVKHTDSSTKPPESPGNP